MTGYEYFETVLKAKGIKAFDVSKGTGIRSGVFSDWKNGRYIPKADKMKQIADFLGIPVEPLITGVEQDENPQYYLDEESARIAQKIFENPGLRMLFDAAEDIDPQDLELAANMVKRFKRTNSDE